MLGESLTAWLLLPLAALALFAGLALLIERLSGFRATALRMPIGLCAALCLSLLVYELGGNGTVALVLLAMTAIAGLVLGRAELATLRPGWPALAAAGAYLLHLAPVVLSGEWTWTGYNFVNDTSVQLLLASQLAEHGAGMPDIAQATTATEHIRVYFITEYPLGAHALLATLSQMVPAPLAAIYQPAIALLAAGLAVGLAALARRMGSSPPAAAAAALVAAGANLYYQYSLQGNIKEIAFLTAWIAGAAAGRELLDADRPLRVVPAVAVCFAAAFASYSAAAAPYLLALGAALAAAAIARRKTRPLRPLVPAGAALLALSLLLALPTLLSAVRFNEIASGTFASAERAADLGHLLRPLELIQAAGIWLTGDYRGPVPGARAAITVVLCVIVLVLACAAVAWSLRRREPAGLVVVAAVVVSSVVLLPRLSPYADGKVIALASPVVVLMAVVGAFALGRRLPPLGWALAAVVALGVMWSNAFAYHFVKLAPVERLEALADVGSRFRDVRGLVMLNEPEELAKNFTGGAPLNVANEAITPRQARLRIPQGFAARYFDLDEYELSYLQGFPVIVKRRSPDASRPPANYRLAYSNEFYEAWVRRPGQRVREHLPLQASQRAALAPPCGDVRRMAAKAGPRDQLVAARRPGTISLDPLQGTGIKGGWPPHPYRPGMVITETPGFASKTVPVPGGGRYRAWVAGSFGRPITVRVDGRRVGAVSGVNNIGQWLEAGLVAIPPGARRLELVRPGGSLAPGNGYDGELGPLVLESLRPVVLERVAAAGAERLCGRAWDWIELVRRSPRAWG